MSAATGRVAPPIIRRASRVHCLTVWTSRSSVLAARQKQAQRFTALGKTELRRNAEADGALLEEIARPDAQGLTLLREASDIMKLSARGYHRVLRVARTIADLDRHEQVARIHIAEALSYRQKLSAFVAAA